MNFGSNYVYSYSPCGSMGSLVGAHDLDRGLCLSTDRLPLLGLSGESGNDLLKSASSEPVLCASPVCTGESGNDLLKSASSEPVLCASPPPVCTFDDLFKAEMKSKPRKHRSFGKKMKKEPEMWSRWDSTGMMNEATNYAWPSRMLDQIDGVIPVSNVLVLYCKDTRMLLLQEPYRRMPQQLCEEVRLLADILSNCGGIYCHFDGYDCVCVDNWSLWVQNMIEQSDFVLTVCSPMFYQVLRDPHHKLVDMLRGKFYPDVIVNCISPHKFIPVFLDMPARDEWVPVNLQTSTYYELYVSDFATAMGNTEGMHPLEFEKKMSGLLEEPRFEKIASLIATLRKESVNPRPCPPPRLIRPVLFGRSLFKALIGPEDENPNVILGEDVERDKRKVQPREVRRADTNIIAVDFSILNGSDDVHTGDCVVCTNANCGAILSHLSHFTEDLDRNEKVWLCEFCATENVVDVEAEEVPKWETTLYLITPPPTSNTDARDDNSLVIFCIDISGSMGVTTEVPGKFVLRNHDHVHAADLQSLNETGESQLLQSEKRDSTYVSRLQGVQAAVESQIASLATENPAQKVAVVTFSDDVKIYCDGSSNITTIAGDKLWKSEVLDGIAKEVCLPPCIAHIQDALCEKVLSLKEGGQTALGPALLVSVLIASRITGSRVVICTDGLANTGVGNLEGISSREAYSAAQTFYSDLGLLAQERGVKVSVVTIKGTDCRVIELGQVADKTGGGVHTVDPLTVTQDFNNILANPTIATNVDVKIVLHAKLYARMRDSEKHESIVKVHVGNVTSDTEITFEYGVKMHTEEQVNHPAEPSPQVIGDEDSSETVKSKHQSESVNVSLLNINGKLYYPFQTQIEYTRHDAARLMKVVTQAKPKTGDRTTAEKAIDVSVVGAHAAHTVAALAIDGEYSQARVNAFAIKKLLKRSTLDDQQKKEEYASAIGRIIPLENSLRDKQEEERMRSKHHCTASGPSSPISTDQYLPTLETAEEAAANNKRMLRHKEADDEMAALAFQLKKFSSV